MDAIELLLERVSSPLLQEPGPDENALEIMFQAALRAPDHARLRPWRFLVVSGEARHALGELLAEVAKAKQPDASEEALARIKATPLRAPTLVLAIRCLKEHPKVPEIEQTMSLAAAVQSLLLAAHAQGVGAIWRTGDLCYQPALAEGLGLADNEQLLGFIYLGTPAGQTKKVPAMDASQFVSSWHGPTDLR